VKGLTMQYNFILLYITRLHNW